jgi:predicted adenylyl cyclase CyaB
LSRNIEIKARIAGVAALFPRAAALADTGPVEILQEDTFFRCEAGRLKLRMFSEDLGELIFYRRADRKGPRESFYLRSPTTAPRILRESLALAYGEVGRVRKQRTLFLSGRTRIHLDRVEGLGEFLELEVVMGDADDAAAGPAEAEAEAFDLMDKLGIGREQLVDVAYVDLLAASRREGSTFPAA